MLKIADLPATAILGNVLVERMREVALSIHITPVKVVGKIILTNVGIGKRRGVRVANLVPF